MEVVEKQTPKPKTPISEYEKAPDRELPFEPEIVTHDLTDPQWGKDYSFKPLDAEGMTAEMVGWWRGIKKDDYLILKNENNTTRYQVETIIYFADPDDMFKAKISFAPRDK